MIHKRRATSSLENGGDKKTVVVENRGGVLDGGTAFPRFGFAAREAAASRGDNGSNGGGGGGSSSNGGGISSSRRQGGVESSSSCACSGAAEKGKKRRGSAAGAGASMYGSRSFWFRVLCVAGQSDVRAAVVEGSSPFVCVR